jgi:acyl-CoA synthetase (AMP-forming)/AMP-acid ligase II
VYWRYRDCWDRADERGQVAAYKLPETIEIVQQLLKEATGTVLKRELRAAPAAGPSRLC